MSTKLRVSRGYDSDCIVPQNYVELYINSTSKFNKKNINVQINKELFEEIKVIFDEIEKDELLKAEQMVKVNQKRKEILENLYLSRDSNKISDKLLSYFENSICDINKMHEGNEIEQFFIKVEELSKYLNISNIECFEIIKLIKISQ